MSKQKIIQIQRFLIIAVLFLLCLILILLILIQNRSSGQNSAIQTKNLTSPKLESPRNFDHQARAFKEFNESLNIIEENPFIEHNESITLSLIKDEKIQMDDNLSSNTKANLEADKNSTKMVPKLVSKTMPKLAIIIDDMANKEQVKNLKKLDLKLNPSFFPPYENHTNIPKLASEFEFYMVHLPLEALNFTHKMPFLSPKDSEEKIEKTISLIRQNFKNLKYINNHTGSLFTSDEKAMRKLFKALAKYELSFVDSRTTPFSKAPQMAEEFQKNYIKRDVFLDNEEDVDYTKNQLRKVVELAQKKGFAIAIGHPKKTTLKALEESKDLLKSVELVYLSEIYGK